MPETLRKAQKYRLYPTKAQAAQMAWTRETCRHVYNSLVNARKFQYEVSGKAPSWIEQKRSITAWKPNHPELSDVYSQVLQDVSKRVDLAFQAFFRRVKDVEYAPELLPPSAEEVGIDVGLKTFASRHSPRCPMASSSPTRVSSVVTKRLWQRPKGNLPSKPVARKPERRPVRLSLVSMNASVTEGMTLFIRPPAGWSTASA